MRSATAFLLICALSNGTPVLSQAPPIQGRISGGFQAPSTVDPEGRRSVVKGTDATPQGNNIYLITDPKVTSYNPDDTAEMFISAPRCLLDLKSNLAWSESGLSVKTADGRFSLEGTGWRWDPNASQLLISNQVAAVVAKAVLATGFTNRAAATTNEPVHITAQRFQQEGDSASFIGDVLVRDGLDTLRCARLNLEFVRPGGVQKVEAVQDVELVQGTTKIQSGHAVYNLKLDLLTITKNPVWNAEEREGSAEKLVMDRARNTLAAEGSVFMKLPLTNVVAVETNTAASARPGPAQTNRFVEIHSDFFQFENATSNRLARAIYRDNVRVVHADAEVRCAELLGGFDREQRLNSLLARGGVEVRSDNKRAYGKTADYHLNEEKFVLEGDPRWEMDDTKGRSDRVVFHPRTSEVLALGNVEMLLPAQASATLLPGATTTAQATNAQLRVTSGTFSQQEKVAVFHEDVRVTDARGEIECRLLTVVTGASNQVERIVAQDEVRITQQDFVASGKRAEYDVRTGLVHLTGEPLLAGPDKTLRAEAFVINRVANTFSVAPGTYRIEMRLKKGQRIPAMFR